VRWHRAATCWRRIAGSHSCWSASASTWTVRSPQHPASGTTPWPTGSASSSTPGSPRACRWPRQRNCSGCTRPTSSGRSPGGTGCRRTGT
jgi:hypothetical protein